MVVITLNGKHGNGEHTITNVYSGISNTHLCTVQKYFCHKAKISDSESIQNERKDVFYNSFLGAFPIILKRDGLPLQHDIFFANGPLFRAFKLSLAIFDDAIFCLVGAAGFCPQLRARQQLIINKSTFVSFIILLNNL